MGLINGNLIDSGLSDLVWIEKYQKLEQQLSQLQQENQKLNDSINQSNLAKISALLKLEKLKQEKEELIKWLENKKKEYYADNEDNVIKSVTLTQVLSKLKESDK